MSDLVERIAADHPAMFLRVRLACEGAVPSIDRDKHAAVICRDVIDAQTFDRLPFGRVAREKRQAAA